MKKLLIGILFVAIIPLSCQRQPRMALAANQSNIVQVVVLSEDYDIYLDQIIALQRQFPISKPTVLRFPVKIHVVNPLINSELNDEAFRKV